MNQEIKDKFLEVTDINKNPRLNKLGCSKSFYNILVELDIDYINS